MRRNLVLFSSVLLTITEWYTFFLVSQLSFIIFPIRLGIIVFILGFIGRVMGSIIFGYVGDKISGRLSITLVTISIIISSFLLIFLANNYYALIISRTLQGLSLGGEWGGASIIVSESFTNSKLRIFILSLVQLAVPIGLIISTSVIFLLSLFSIIKLWNYSFLLTIILSVISTTLILSNFEERRVTSLVKIPLVDAIRKEWKNVLIAIGIKVSESSNFYIFTSYVFSQSVSTNLISSVVLISILTQLITMPFFGYLANSIGRKIILTLGLIIFALGSLFLKSDLLLGELLLSISDSALYSPQSSLFVDLFDKKYRYTTTNFSYQLASIIGGSLSPSLLALTHLQVIQIVIPYILASFICLLLIGYRN
ncbi:MFS transporter [Saccharolobus sp. A20]|uniref:MFS transporter n=1 Tax=Saccharolobus sp. A20 TaxID=1891280 RepID=UPI000845D393|nr:MFS transporter [Sulfolobus sp. A20]